MSTEVPFKISIPDTQLELLRKKLDLVTFPDELEDAGSRYGVPLADIKRLVARWKDGFDWRVEEAKLNDEMPQFTRDIEVSDGHGTLNVHYVHKRSEVDGAVPLLFVHGCDFIESRKILPLLTEASRDGDFPSFHVVALSLPGFGFSEAPKKSGFTPDYHAEVAHKLMLSLGYNEYVTQGGDWGYVITRKIAMKYGGTHSKAWHTNMSMGFPPLNPISHPILFLQWMLTPYSEPEKAGFARWKQFQKEENGYYILQCNKPQTVGYGYALADSPVGLLGWIYEGLVNWTDEYPWTDDEVLTWISIYLFSRAGPTASFRIYYEAQHSKDSGFISLTGGNPKIPMGVSRFPKDMVVAPMSWIKTTGNVVFAGDHTSVGTNKGGGHFAAYERPEALVEDLRNMFGRGGPAFGVTSKKGGYFEK
ncbi:alpha/beta-hydrolase [Dendrothele bispora CBS 962.96]|uniref:Alpha/beta-hydrolase n=1 Tax=Dendrothele bispora (strain CBS 962.96) TaxID=1314807 RepID=A0A4S8MHX1_DENBC|nr:alpha/beta-hydrolase [Dendrothele bispora CBS 962.96]